MAERSFHSLMKGTISAVLHSRSCGSTRLILYWRSSKNISVSFPCCVGKAFYPMAHQGSMLNRTRYRCGISVIVKNLNW